MRSIRSATPTAATGGTLAVEGLSIAVEEGEFAAVVGPSGCGKSTLMKLATGLQFPFKGTVKVASELVHQPVKIAGMAFQAPTLAAVAHDAGKSPAAAGDRASRTVANLRRNKSGIRRPRRKRCSTSVGLAGQSAKFPWELSGGMQQRTSLCRALIHEPKLLMLDEPFGALDAFTREELWCVIRDLHAARKITIILVTHDLREAVFLADRVFVMSSRPGPHAGRTQDRIAAPARPRSDVHAGIPGHRA